MHFWIDKRNQCTYTGRHRVPASLSAGGVGRARGRLAARKSMAAPVHRFAAVECPPRRPHRPHRPVRNERPAPDRSRHCSAPPVPVHSSRRNEDASLYVEIPLEPPQPTIASLAAARSVTPDTLLRTAALGLQHSPMMAPHLKFGMLVSFALATMFLAGAKYYFDRQTMRGGGNAGAGGAGAGGGGSGGAGVVCAAVACVCGVGCALSLCRTTPHPAPLAHQPDRVSSTAQRHRADTDNLMQQSREVVPRAAETAPEPHPALEGAASPPPYHIAVLLPPRPASPPPPAYSAIS